MSRRKQTKTIETDRDYERVLIVNRPSLAQFAEATRRAGLPARTLIGSMLGDPPVGLSALDKQNKTLG